MMERKLSQLFDRQRFQQSERLASIISGVERRYAKVMSDNDLELVNAAGDADAMLPRAELMTEKEQPLVYGMDEEYP